MESHLVVKSKRDDFSRGGPYVTQTGDADKRKEKKGQAERIKRKNLIRIGEPGARGNVAKLRVNFFAQSCTDLHR